jgi:peptidoglycan/LPS O-acetylase OafA/YrhL
MSFTKRSLLVCAGLLASCVATEWTERNPSLFQRIPGPSILIHKFVRAYKVRAGHVTMRTNTSSEAVAIKQKVDSASLNPNFALNLSCLDGIRCLACFAVVFYHVYFLHGGGFFLSTAPCFAAMRHIPVVGSMLMEISWHMTLFWLISGFLCERQLHVMMLRHKRQQVPKDDSSTALNGNKTAYLTWRHYGRFFINRLLRLYPLYAVLTIMLHKRHSGRPELQSPDMVHSRCDSNSQLRALTFTMDFMRRDHLCAGTGWTLQNDIKGHLVIAILFALTNRYSYDNENKQQKRFLQYKQLFLWAWYACSVVSMVATRPFPHQWLSGASLKHYSQSARLGLDLYDDRGIVLLDVSHSGLADLFPGERHRPMMQAIRNFRLHQVFSTYFTGITRHGSAILIGSLLYSNLYERQGRPSNSLWKLLAAVTLLTVSQGSYIFSGLVMYWIIDVMLTFRPGRNVWSKTFHRFLTNPLFLAIVPYTYGIYLFHGAYIVARYAKLTPIRAAAVRAGVDACHAGIEFNWQFIWKEAITAFVVSLAIAILLRWTVEFPFHWFRKRFLTGGPAVAAGIKKNV